MPLGTLADEKSLGLICPRHDARDLEEWRYMFWKENIVAVDLQRMRNGVGLEAVNTTYAPTGQSIDKVIDCLTVNHRQPDSSIISGGSQLPVNRLWGIFLERRNWWFYIPPEKYIGLAPRRSHHSDELVVLPNACMPLVIRRLRR